MGNKLFVGNIANTTNEANLQTLFATAGSVVSLKIITDRDTGRSKGFGFVEMMTDDEANAAIKAFDGKDFEGRPLRVSEAKPQAPRSGGSSFGGRNDNGGERRGFSSRGY